jgi:hypothetical protein
VVLSVESCTFFRGRQSVSAAAWQLSALYCGLCCNARPTCCLCGLPLVAQFLLFMWAGALACDLLYIDTVPHVLGADMDVSGSSHIRSLLLLVGSPMQRVVGHTGVTTGA